MSSAWDIKAAEYAPPPLMESVRFPPNPSLYPGNRAVVPVRSASGPDIITCTNNPQFLTNMPQVVQLAIGPSDPIPIDVIELFRATNDEFKDEFISNKDKIPSLIHDGYLRFTKVTYSSKKKCLIQDPYEVKDQTSKKKTRNGAPNQNDEKKRHTSAALVMCIKSSNYWANAWKSLFKDWVPMDPPTDIMSWIKLNGLPEHGRQLFPKELDLETRFRYYNELDLGIPTVNTNGIKYMNDAPINDYFIRPVLVYLIEMWFHVNNRYVIPLIPKANLPRRLRVYMASIDGGQSDVGFCQWNLLCRFTSGANYFTLATQCGLGAFIAVVLSHYIHGKHADYKDYYNIIQLCDKLSNQQHESYFEGMKYNICDIEGLRSVATNITRVAWPHVERLYKENNRDIIETRTSHFSDVTYEREKYKLDTEATRTENLYGFSIELFANTCLDFGMFENMFHPTTLNHIKVTELLYVMFYGHSVTRTKEMISHLTNHRCKIQHLFNAASIPYLLVYHGGGLMSPESEIPYFQRTSLQVNLLPMSVDMDPLSPTHYDYNTFAFLASRGIPLTRRDGVNREAKVRDWVAFRFQFNHLTGEDYKNRIAQYELVLPLYGIYVDKSIPVTWMETIKIGFGNLSETRGHLRSLFKVWSAFRCILEREEDVLASTMELFFMGALAPSESKNQEDDNNENDGEVKPQRKPFEWRKQLFNCMEKLQQHTKLEKERAEIIHKNSLSIVSNIRLTSFRDSHQGVLDTALQNYTTQYLIIVPGYVSDSGNRFIEYTLEPGSLGSRIIRHIISYSLSPVVQSVYLSEDEDITSSAKRHRIKLRWVDGESSELMTVNDAINRIRSDMDDVLWPEVFRLYNLFHPQLNIEYKRYRNTITDDWHQVESTTRNVGEYKIRRAVESRVSSLSKKSEGQWLTDLINSDEFIGRPIGDLIVSNCSGLREEEKDQLIQSTAICMFKRYIEPLLQDYSRDVLNELKNILPAHQFQITSGVLTYNTNDDERAYECCFLSFVLC